MNSANAGFSDTLPSGPSTRSPEKSNGLSWSLSFEIQFSQKMRSTPSSRRVRISSGSACARRAAWSSRVVSKAVSYTHLTLPTTPYV